MLGIVVILNVFFSVITALAFPAPKYEDYCPVQPMVAPTDAASCDVAGGIWSQYPATPPDSATPAGFCDMYAKCQKPYQAASEQHALAAFVLLVGLGIVALVAGLMPLGSSIVSTGLSYGGVLALVIGSAQYWGTAGNWIRLAIASAGLLALLYVGWRRFRD